MKWSQSSAGAGVVFKARHLKLNRIVALKMLLAGAYAGPEELGRFRREAEAVAALRHPNIVQVHDAGEVTGRPYFTMEYVEGGSLAQNLAGAQQPPRRAAELVATLASAVQFAHQSGFIHRDLKPGNILLAADGTPRISDFGLARSIATGPEFTLTGVRLGTPSYMAPEQAMGKASATGPAADVYSLGAVLYEMLTGRPPFEGESAAETERQVIAEEPVPPSRLNTKVPRDVENICLKCLSKNPSRRYASALDLADDLHRFLDGKPVVARRGGAAERLRKWVRRRPAAAGLLAAVVLLVAAGCVGSWLLYHQRAAAWARQAQTDQEVGTVRERARDLLEEGARLGNRRVGRFGNGVGIDQPLCGRFLQQPRQILGRKAGGHPLHPRRAAAGNRTPGLMRRRRPRWRHSNAGYSHRAGCCRADAFLPAWSNSS